MDHGHDDRMLVSASASPTLASTICGKVASHGDETMNIEQ